MSDSIPSGVRDRPESDLARWLKSGSAGAGLGGGVWVPEGMLAREIDAAGRVILGAVPGMSKYDAAALARAVISALKKCQPRIC